MASQCNEHDGPEGSCRCWLQIEKCKLSIREAVKECEESGGDKAIALQHFDEDGEIEERHIFCSKCLEPESYEVCLRLIRQSHVITAHLKGHHI